MGKGRSQTSTTVAQPYGPAQPLLNDVINYIRMGPQAPGSTPALAAPVAPPASPAPYNPGLAPGSLAWVDGQPRSMAGSEGWEPSPAAGRSSVGATASGTGVGSGGGVNLFRVDPFTGQRVADLSDTTMAGINALSAMGTGPLMTGAQDALLQNLSMDQTYRDFDAIRSSVGDSVQARLAGMFNNGGINSSLAGDTYTRALTEALAGVEYGAYGDARDRQMRAAGMAPQIAAAGPGFMLSAGGLLDDQAQRQISAGMDQFYETENADIDAIQRYANIATQLGGAGGTQSTTQRGGGSFAQTLGTVGSAASGIGGLLSVLGICDRRLKENILQDGDAYLFNYPWSPVRHRNIMADEHPEAIAGSWHGFVLIDPARVA